jgi:hypothetical protein
LAVGATTFFFAACAFFAGAFDAAGLVAFVALVAVAAGVAPFLATAFFVAGMVPLAPTCRSDTGLDVTRRGKPREVCSTLGPGASSSGERAAAA